MRINSFDTDGGSVIAEDLSRLEAMVEAVVAATPTPKVIPFERCSMFSWADPSTRRAFALAVGERGEKLDALAHILSASAAVPLWLARMAMDAAIPVDHERRLDAKDDHLPALRAAAAALGLDPAIVEARPDRLDS